MFPERPRFSCGSWKLMQILSDVGCSLVSTHVVCTKVALSRKEGTELGGKHLAWSIWDASMTKTGPSVQT